MFHADFLLFLQVYDQGNSKPSYIVFLASGRHVFACHIPESAVDAAGERGKGGVYLPFHMTENRISFIQIPQLSLPSEIQSLQVISRNTSEASGNIAAHTLAIVDCFGRALRAGLILSSSEDLLEEQALHVNHERARQDEKYFVSNFSMDSMTAQQLPFQITDLEPLQPNELLVDAGWAGIAISSDESRHSAVARHFARDVTVFDGAFPVRTIHTIYTPYSIELLSPSIATGTNGSAVVTVAEGPSLSIWDVRVAGRGARVARMMSSPHAGHLYCTSVLQDSAYPLIGAAGQDRTVSVWDPRRWRLLAVWNNCTKYEATYLHFPTCDPAYCMVGGLDYEVLVGKWGGSKRSRLGGGTRTGGSIGKNLDRIPNSKNEDSKFPETFSMDATVEHQDSIAFRGDSGWKGLAISSKNDVFAGITANKQLYLGRIIC